VMVNMNKRYIIFLLDFLNDSMLEIT